MLVLGGGRGEAPGGVGGGGSPQRDGGPRRSSGVRLEAGSDPTPSHLAHFRGYITAQSLSFLSCKRGYKHMEIGLALLITKEM